MKPTRWTRLLALAACAVLGWFGLSSLEQGRPGIPSAEAAQGCGAGYHRDVYGYCRPNYYGAPYYGARAVYGRRGYGYGYRGGYHGGRYGYRGRYGYHGRGGYGPRVAPHRGSDGGHSGRG